MHALKRQQNCSIGQPVGDQGLTLQASGLSFATHRLNYACDDEPHGCDQPQNRDQGHSALGHSGVSHRIDPPPAATLLKVLSPWGKACSAMVHSGHSPWVSTKPRRTCSGRLSAIGQPSCHPLGHACAVLYLSGRSPCACIFICPMPRRRTRDCALDHSEKMMSGAPGENRSTSSRPTLVSSMASRKKIGRAHV